METAMNYGRKKMNMTFLKPKRANESHRDSVFRRANYTCVYCGDKCDKKDLRLVQTEPTMNVPLSARYVCSCGDCAKAKGTKSHEEFIYYMKTRMRLVRQEMLDNYDAIAEEVFSKYGHECIYCKAEFGTMPKGKKLTIDHKRSVMKLGSNYRENLCCSCLEHNRDKGSMNTKEYMDVIQVRKRMGIDFDVYYVDRERELRARYGYKLQERISMLFPLLHEESETIQI